MKAILEFNLPDDREDFDIATRSCNLLIAVVEMNRDLRQACCKHKLDSFLADHAYVDANEQEVVSVDALTQYLHDLYTALLDVQAEQGVGHLTN